jgi:hypothetical protein
MTTLHDKVKTQIEKPLGRDRRQFRRHDLEMTGIPVERWDGARRASKPFGKIVDISAGGVRIRTDAKNVRADAQLRLRLDLPNYAGISPFISATAGKLEPKNEWVGWMTVARVSKREDGTVDVAGQLVDMEEMDRGMLGLYLSTQPLAA